MFAFGQQRGHPFQGSDGIIMTFYAILLRPPEKYEYTKFNLKEDALSVLFFWPYSCIRKEIRLRNNAFCIDN